MRTVAAPSMPAGFHLKRSTCSIFPTDGRKTALMTVPGKLLICIVLILKYAESLLLFRQSLCRVVNLLLFILCTREYMRSR